MFPCNPQFPRNSFRPPRVIKNPPPPWLPRPFQLLIKGFMVNMYFKHFCLMHSLEVMGGCRIIQRNEHVTKTIGFDSPAGA